MFFRKQFIEFKGRKIDNVTTTNGVYVKSISNPTSPKYTFTTTMIPNTDMTLYNTAGLEDRRIVAVFAIYAKNIQEKRQKINALVKGWHGNVAGKLVIGDDPNVYYEARVLEEIQENEADGHTEVTVPFIASAKKYAHDETVINIAVNTASVLLEYLGDYKALPIIELTGTGTIHISCNGKSFSCYLQNETVFIDCKELIVHDGSFNNKIGSFTGNFIELYEGANTITLSGNATITTKIKYRNTYLTGGSYA